MFKENQKIKELTESRDKWKAKAKEYRKRVRTLEDLLRYYKKKPAGND
jgi:uncharacterized coiled-coil DUF342 family protein